MTARKAKHKNPFQKATSLRDNAQNKKAARLMGESSSGAPLESFEMSNSENLGHQKVAGNGQAINLDGRSDPAAEAKQKTAQELQQETDPAQSTKAAQREAAETARNETEEAEPENIEQSANDGEILQNEVWQTHYDYDDVVRNSFDKLRVQGEHLAVDFATRFMVDPKGSDPEEIATQVLAEETKRVRFSDNENVEAGHAAMMEISQDAAAEFRRVIGILGEDVDLDAITSKIRERFATIDAVSSGLDPNQMIENQIIRELRVMGFEIIAPAGGPYSVTDTSGGRISKPFDLLELREFLKEMRADMPADRN